MPADYFGEYSSREEYIVQKWIHEFFDPQWIDCQYIPDNTGFHDCKIQFEYGWTNYEFIVQIKEEEAYWYDRTWNLWFDFLSAFKYRDDDVKEYVLKNNYRIPSRHIEKFVKNWINVGKFGKLITCDADIHIFYVEEDNTHETKFIHAYNNYTLQSEEYIEYIIGHYKLRVNKKSDYDLADNWESAAFFIKPTEQMIKNAEINHVEDLISICENKDEMMAQKSHLFW